MFDGYVDAERYLARIWEQYEDPAAHQYLVYGVGRRLSGTLYPVAKVVVGGPERASQLIEDLDIHQPEQHGGIPIFRVDYAGRD